MGPLPPAARRLAGLLPLAALGVCMPAATTAGAARAASTLGGGGGGAAAGGGGQAPGKSSGDNDRLAPGAAFTLTKRYTPDEVAAFAASTGDSNAIHTSGGAAAAAGLPGAILPGLLMAALFPAIIGSQFPGALYLSQTLKFRQHALVGDSVTAALTVEKRSGSRVTFRTLCCHDGSGRVLVEGSALALIRQQQGQQRQGQMEQSGQAGD